MAAKKKAAKAPEPAFQEMPVTRLKVKSNHYRVIETDVTPEEIVLDPTGERPIEIEWNWLPNFLAALTRAQEIHAGAKTAELPLFGEGAAPGVTQADLDEDPEDDEEEDDGD